MLNYSVVSILNELKTYEIILGISSFRQLTPKTSSREELKNRFHSAVPVNLIIHQTINKNELYRIRQNTSKIPFTRYSDFWNPANENTKIGRLNRDKQSLLYVCLDPVTPFHEAKINVGDYFTLIDYHYISENKLSGLLLEGLSTQSKALLFEVGLTENGIINYFLLNDFIRTELIKDVGEGTEYLYEITNMIKEYFDNENKENAFLYSSINNYARRNCAIKSDVAKSYLKCTGCLYGIFLGYSYSEEFVQVKPLGRCSKEIYSDKDIIYDYFSGDGTIILRMNSDK